MVFIIKISRKYLSAKGLLQTVYEHFKSISITGKTPLDNSSISIADCLMSGLAIFGLKFPSLLKFDEQRKETPIKHNLKTLYNIEQAPSDTYMRERCDEVDPKYIRTAFKKIMSHVQRGNGLKQFEYLDSHYLLAGDGTGFFSSSKVKCENCCVKHHNKCHVKIIGYKPDDLSAYKKNTYLLIHNSKQDWLIWFINSDKEKTIVEIDSILNLKVLLTKMRVNLSTKEKQQIKLVVSTDYNLKQTDAKISFYHNMFCAAIVHPNLKLVLPLAPEPIMKTDGSSKNDCEYNAAKRMYADARREHPHLKFIVVEDSIASNVPHLTDLKNLNMRYIVGVKPSDHKFLFNFIKDALCNEYSHTTDDGVTHTYRYLNDVQLNKSHSKFKTNFLEYWETSPNGKSQHFCWVTDILITEKNIYQIMQGGRVNWKIENNTFNTLKNQNYHFSHNFGHGKKHLCTVFSMLMMLAFFIDQVQELYCNLFKEARLKFKSRTSLWEKIRGMTKEFYIDSWDDLFNSIAVGYEKSRLAPNTS